MLFESNISHRINKRIKYIFIYQKLNANLNKILLSDSFKEKNKTKNFLFEQKLYL